MQSKKLRHQPRRRNQLTKGLHPSLEKKSTEIFQKSGMISPARLAVVSSHTFTTNPPRLPHISPRSARQKLENPPQKRPSTTPEKN
jgi:hypothetical protein